jgi:hypothetical protein
MARKEAVMSIEFVDMSEEAPDVKMGAVYKCGIDGDVLPYLVGQVFDTEILTVISLHTGDTIVFDNKSELNRFMHAMHAVKISDTFAKFFLATVQFGATKNGGEL